MRFGQPSKADFGIDCNFDSSEISLQPENALSIIFVKFDGIEIPSILKDENALLKDENASQRHLKCDLKKQFQIKLVFEKSLCQFFFYMFKLLIMYVILGYIYN